MKQKGLLVVCEGLDCSGKTTTIKKLMKNNNGGFIYSKGIGSDSWIGRTSSNHPSTFSLFIELVYNTFARIRPGLRKGKIVLQDRYDISITSFVPLTDRWYNQLFINLFKPFIEKPDAVIYFHLPLEERVKRLYEKGTPYEISLAKNPSQILAREREYEIWFNNFRGPKIRINTYQNDIEKTSRITKKFIEKIVSS
ncbi:MAG: AAA family ATPase [Nanoarchaeota archaeon]|nr:AAA family ATPase [Nanoarchaeota archaeon]